MSNEHDSDKVSSRNYAGLFQTYLPLLLSLIAIIISARGEYRRSEEAKSTYNQGRIELFRQMTEKAANGEQMKQIYREVFPRDARLLQDEQNAMAGK